MDLRVVARGYVTTHDGEREIQFLLGDITALPVEEKVDIIIISAFAGDYSAIHGTVVGALKFNLDINVKELAKNKEEDLRKTLCCWYSKPLPEDLPYRRVMCFEKLNRDSSTPDKFVGLVFRAMMPIFGKEDSSVITPILASGNQGFSETMMLKAMMEGAVQWMRAGLPLKCLKIVQYTRDLRKRSKDDARRIAFFHEVMDHVNAKALPPEPKLKYDVYLCAAKSDEQVANQFVQKLRDVRPELQIYKENSDQGNVADMDQLISSSFKMVSLMTNEFLKSQSCLERFNVGLCCHRRLQRDLMAPVCLSKVDDLPSYMSLIQWMDCRQHTEESIILSCKAIIERLEIEKQSSGNSNETGYDVFVSYCHRNQAVADRLVQSLQQNDPDIKIFFDRTELKTGTSWQETLYNSIDNSKIVIALISSDYIKSSVCNEEYTIAMARFLRQDSPLCLIPVLIGDVDDIPSSLVCQRIIDCRNGNKTEFVNLHLTAMVRDALRTDLSRNDFAYLELAHITAIRSKFDVFQHAMELRRRLLGEKISDGRIRFESMKSVCQGLDGTSVCDVAFSYCARDEKYARFLERVLKEFHLCAALRSSLSLKSEDERRKAFDQAKIIVVLISNAYVRSRRQWEELQIALYRQRKEPNQLILYPVLLSQLGDAHSHYSLLQFETALSDDVWKGLTDEKEEERPWKLLPREVLAMKIPGWSMTLTEMFSVPQLFALMKAAEDLVLLLSGQRFAGVSRSDRVFLNPLELAMTVEKTQAVDYKEVLLGVEALGHKPPEDMPPPAPPQPPETSPQPEPPQPQPYGSVSDHMGGESKHDSKPAHVETTGDATSNSATTPTHNSEPLDQPRTIEGGQQEKEETREPTSVACCVM